MNDDRNDERPALLRSLLSTLKEEEGHLGRLADLSQSQRRALIDSDFMRLEAINDEMLAAANALVPLEARRAAIVAGLGIASITEAAELARTFRIEGFAAAHERLRMAADTFRSCQEQNAALVLSAMKLRDRWISFLGGRLSPTYGAGGKREIAQQRQVISKSA